MFLFSWCGYFGKWWLIPSKSFQWLFPPVFIFHNLAFIIWICALFLQAFSGERFWLWECSIDLQSKCLLTQKPCLVWKVYSSIFMSVWWLLLWAYSNVYFFSTDFGELIIFENFTFCKCTQIQQISYHPFFHWNIYCTQLAFAMQSKDKLCLHCACLICQYFYDFKCVYLCERDDERDLHEIFQIRNAVHVKMWKCENLKRSSLYTFNVTAPVWSFLEICL